MALILIPPKIQFFDNDVEPLVNGKLYTYQAGTSTPKVTYQDEAETVPNTNPVILDSRGEALVRLVGSYKMKLTDSSDVEIWTVDNITEYDVRDWSGLTATIAELNATNTSCLPKTGDYTTILTDRGKTVLVDATAADPTKVVLLDAVVATNGYQITIKKIDKTTNRVEIDPQTSQVIDGIDPFYLYDYNDFVKVLSDGSNWHLIAAKVRGTLITEDTTPLNITLEDKEKTYLVDSSSGAFAVSLPAINTLARAFQIGFKKVDSTSNIITITPNGSETIDGESDLSLTDQYEAVTLKPDGSNWFIISEYGANSSRTSPLPIGYRFGIIIANNVADTAHDIDFGAGKWRSSDDTTNLIFPVTLTKRIDANWVAGTGNGGFPSGISLAQDTWYHCFLIGKPDGTTDAGFDSAVDASNLLADATGYTKYRRVGSVKTEATTTNLLQFTQKDNYFRWKSVDDAWDFSGSSTTAVLEKITTPLGIKVNAHLAMSGVFTTNNPSFYFSDPDVDDEVPATFGAVTMEFYVAGPTNYSLALTTHVITDVSSQIRVRSSNTGSTYNGRAIGWVDFFDNY